MVETNGRLVVLRGHVASQPFQPGEDGFIFELVGKGRPPLILEYRPEHPERTAVLLAGGKGEASLMSPNADGTYRVSVGLRKGSKGWFVLGSDLGNHFAVLEMEPDGSFTRKMVFLVVQNDQVYVREQVVLRARVVRGVPLPRTIKIVPTIPAPLWEGWDGFNARWTNTSREAIALAQRLGIAIPSEAEVHVPSEWEAPSDLDAHEAVITWWYTAGGYGGAWTNKGPAFFHIADVEAGDGFVEFAPGESIHFDRIVTRTDGKRALTKVERA